MATEIVLSIYLGRTPALYLTLLIALLLLPASQAVESSALSKERAIFKLPEGYYRGNSPNGNSTTNVEIYIYIAEFYSLSEATMDFSLSIYLQQKWTDPRLKFDPREAGGQNSIILGDNMWDKIWVPDVYFANEKKANYHSVTTPNRKMQLKFDGEVFYSMKLSITLSCLMDLLKYPRDTQMCSIILESFSYTKDTLTLNWRPHRDSVSPVAIVPQFSLLNISYDSCDADYGTGTYPCRIMMLVMKRYLSYYIIQVYIPMALVVMLSWLTFWLKTDASTARVCLACFAIAIVNIQTTGFMFMKPKVSYVMSLDIWVMACLVFVIGSLLEFVIVYVLSQGCRASESNQQQLQLQSEKMVKIANVIDCVCRGAFPATFLLFNIIYWST